MDQQWEVTLDWGDDGPEEGEETPTATDIERAVLEGLQEHGFTVDRVTAQLR